MFAQPEHRKYEAEDTQQLSAPQMKLTVRGHTLEEGSYVVHADDELRMKLLISDKKIDPKHVTIRLQHEDEESLLCKPREARTAMLSGKRSILFTIELPKANPNDLSHQLLDEINEASEQGLLSREDAAELRAYRNTLAANLVETFHTAVPGHYTVQALYDMKPEPLESDMVRLNVIPLEYTSSSSKAPLHRSFDIRGQLHGIEYLLRRVLGRTR